MSKAEVKRILEELENNAIFKLSLSSNELFHSNFWHWLLTKYYDTVPEVVKVFYPDYKGGLRKDTIKRENHHTDLSFICDEKLIIIENKIKSYPNAEQLIKYAKDNQNINRIILISYFEPVFLQNLEKESDRIYKYDEDKVSFKIEHLSYQILQERLETFIKNIRETSECEIENKYIIKNYIKCLKLLNNLYKNIMHENNTYDLYDNNFGAINDIYIKYRTAELTEYIRENIDDEYNVCVDFDFNHKKGTINIVINDESSEAKEYDFRIQIEGDQFRWCIRHETKKIEDLALVLKDLYEKNLWFLDTETYQKEFCHYGEHFIYRYKKMNKIFRKELNRISYKEIAEYINNVLKDFSNNKDEIRQYMK